MIATLEEVKEALVKELYEVPLTQAESDEVSEDVAAVITALNKGGLLLVRAKPVESFRVVYSTKKSRSTKKTELKGPLGKTRQQAIHRWKSNTSSDAQIIRVEKTLVAVPSTIPEWEEA